MIVNAHFGVYQSLEPSNWNCILIQACIHSEFVFLSTIVIQRSFLCDAQFSEARISAPILDGRPSNHSRGVASRTFVSITEIRHLEPVRIFIFVFEISCRELQIVFVWVILLIRFRSDTLQFNTRARYLWDAQFRPPELDPTSGLYITKATVYDYAMAELVEAFPSPPTDPNSSVPDRPLMSLEQFISGLESLKPFPAPRAVGGVAMSRSASVSASPAVSARGPTPGVLNPNQQKCVIQ
jgi:hypothetical protein